MLFTDEEARHKYHKASTLLQVVCQMVESELTQYHMQLEFVDVEEQGDLWKALLVAVHPDFDDDAILQQNFELVAGLVNLRFKRSDRQDTVSVESGSLGLLTVRVSSHQDLAQLQ